jgi:hypothetical protein
VNEYRQQILLGVLLAIGLYLVGDYVWIEQIQKPLGELKGEHAEMVEDLGKYTKTFKRTKTLPNQIAIWEKQALPANTETARSLYRNWLLETIRTAKLRNARVDSGSPSSRSGYKVMPVNAQARGTLDEITDALFAFENAALLHKIASIRLSPISDNGQFDLAMSIEAVMMSGVKRRSLKPGVSRRLVSSDRRSYDIISRDNMFGIAVDHRDPMKMTKLTGVIYRNADPQVWITEQIIDRVHKLEKGASFDTTALTGRVAEIGEDWVIIESGEQRLKLTMGQSFAEATVVSGS